jgi:hypothetical protein
MLMAEQIVVIPEKFSIRDSNGVTRMSRKIGHPSNPNTGQGEDGPRRDNVIISKAEFDVKRALRPLGHINIENQNS